MGVKSTIHLTRAEAIAKYVSLKQEKMIRRLEAEATILSNVELEDILEEMNDAYYKKEYGSWGGFDNYIIDGN